MKLADIIITDTRDFISVEEPGGSRHEIRWNALTAVDFETTDDGPSAVNLWLVLHAETLVVRIPLGHLMYDAVYAKVKMLDGFRWENIINAFTSRQDATFELWRKPA